MILLSDPWSHVHACKLQVKRLRRCRHDLTVIQSCLQRSLRVINSTCAGRTHGLAFTRCSFTSPRSSVVLLTVSLLTHSADKRSSREQQEYGAVSRRGLLL